MSAAASISRMQQAIINYLGKVIQDLKEQNKARVGTVSGNRVIIGNKSYPYTPAVDMYFGNGSQVFCILPDKGNQAAVVGVK